MKNSPRHIAWQLEQSEAFKWKTWGLTMPGLIAIHIISPENLEHILKTKFDNYPKGKEFYNINYEFFWGWNF